MSFLLLLRLAPRFPLRPAPPPRTDGLASGTRGLRPASSPQPTRCPARRRRAGRLAGSREKEAQRLKRCRRQGRSSKYRSTPARVEKCYLSGDVDGGQEGRKCLSGRNRQGAVGGEMGTLSLPPVLSPFTIFCCWLGAIAFLATECLFTSPFKMNRISVLQQSHLGWGLGAGGWGWVGVS